MSLEMLESHIKKQIQVILASVNFQDSKIQIHYFFGSNKEDIGRTAFTIYTLSKTKEFLSQDILDNLISFANSYSDKLQISFDEKNITAFCYLLRAKKELGLDLTKDIEFLEKQNLHTIYQHPVSMYVFISMAQELDLNINSYLFSIRNECLKVFEYLLLSDSISDFPIFSLAEVNYWKNNLADSSSFLEKTNKYLLGRLEKENLKDISSSGLAKCAEFVSLAENSENISSKIFSELENRKVKNFPSILFANSFNNENMYLENYSNAHICLDTNTHLLLTYLNMHNSPISKIF